MYLLEELDAERGAMESREADDLWYRSARTGRSDDRAIWKVVAWRPVTLRVVAENCCGGRTFCVGATMFCSRQVLPWLPSELSASQQPELGREFYHRSVWLFAPWLAVSGCRAGNIWPLDLLHTFSSGRKQRIMGSVIIPYILQVQPCSIPISRPSHLVPTARVPSNTSVTRPHRKQRHSRRHMTQRLQAAPFPTVSATPPLFWYSAGTGVMGTP